MRKILRVLLILAIQLLLLGGQVILSLTLAALNGGQLCLQILDLGFLFGDGLVGILQLQGQISDLHLQIFNFNLLKTR